MAKKTKKKTKVSTAKKATLKTKPAIVVTGQVLGAPITSDLLADIDEDLGLPEESSPEFSIGEVEPIKWVFGIEHEGQSLYGVTMYEMQGNVVVSESKILSGEFARNAVKRMGQAAMQIEINGLKPDRLRTMEVMPSINGQR